MKSRRHSYGPSNKELDLSKIHKGTPCAISPKAKSAFISELESIGIFTNHYGRDLGLTLEKVYRQQNGITDHIPPNMARMSKECMAWAGLDRHDPYVPVKKSYPEWSVLHGSLHTFSSVSSSTISVDMIIEIVKTMPEHGEEKENQV